MLPVAAALAILFAVVAAVAGPAWFDRDKAGFEDPTLEPSVLGLLTIVLVPVQIMLIAPQCAASSSSGTSRSRSAATRPRAIGAAMREPGARSSRPRGAALEPTIGGPPPGWWNGRHRVFSK